LNVTSDKMHTIRRLLFMAARQQAKQADNGAEEGSGRRVCAAGVAKQRTRGVNRPDPM
jgi:hypothetical protein